MVVILIATNFVFLFFGSGDLQEWNEPNKIDDHGEDLKKTSEQTKENKISENGNQHYKF